MLRLRNFIFLACILTFIVILMGAFTRLTDSGLGCPDWPLCYGNLTPITTVVHSTSKAWIEMIHRYLAFTLGLVILVLFIATLIKKHHEIVLIAIASCALFTVVIQATLGMFTVTLQLHALSVSLHLLFAFILLALLTSWYIKFDPKNKLTNTGVFVGLFFLLIQVFLGANVSATHSALVCPNLPLCPLTQFNAHNLINMFSNIFQYGKLSSTIERINLQMLHRLWGLILLCYFIGLTIYYHINSKTMIKRYSIAISVILILQAIIGMMNVALHNTLFTALLHTTIATLLLIMMTYGLFLRVYNE